MNISTSLLELINIFNNNKLGHAYLFETNNVDRCLNELKYVIKNILCEEKYENDCNKCSLCNLIENEELSDLMIIRPENKTIKKDQIDNLKKHFSLKAMYTSKKVYVIIYPEKMNSTAFNKLLKFLEEPEDNIIGFFITGSKDNIASTIVSRCETLKIIYNKTENNVLDDEDNENANLVSIASELCNKIINKEEDYLWFNDNVSNSLNSREEVIIFMQYLYNEVSKHKEIIINSKLILKILQKYLMQLNYNVNVKLLLNSFFIEVGELNGK